MNDKRFKETPQVHSCKFAYGKLTDVMFSQPSNFYCRRCNKLLLITQVDEKVLRRYIKNYKEVEL